MTRGHRARIERQIMANLFLDVVLPVSLQAVEQDVSGSSVWTGRVSGEPDSTVTIAVNEEAMSGSFSVPGHAYAIRPVNGGHEAIEIDSKAFPNEIAPVVAGLSESSFVQTLAIAPSDSASTFDVLVAYTHIVRINYGSTAAVESLISNAIASTNAAYANSAVTPRLRLVGTMELTYDDQTTTFLTTLSRLRSTTDGHMDAIHARRTAVGADDVSLLVWFPTDNFCGIGYLMSSPPGPGFAPNAFNVVRDDCAVDNLSFAHELGHNFGLEHDRANTGPDPNPSYPYAFGYQDTSQLFRDIMAFNCPTINCPRIQYFSNPNVLFGGRPLGVNFLAINAADNARALNNNAGIIANWRQATIPTIVFTDDPLVVGATVIKGVHMTELRSAINSVRAGVGLPAVIWSDSLLLGVMVKATHITELRNALTPALAVLGITPTYTDGTLTSSVPVKAIHLQELRNYVR